MYGYMCFGYKTHITLTFTFILTKKKQILNVYYILYSIFLIERKKLLYFYLSIHLSKNTNGRMCDVFYFECIYLIFFPVLSGDSTSRCFIF